MIRVLLIRPDKAGDALKSLSAIRGVANLPNVEVTLWLSEHNASLFEHEPKVRTKVLDESFDVAILLPLDPTKPMLQILEKVMALRKFSALNWGSPAKKNEAESVALFVSKSLGVPDFPVDSHAVPVLSKQDFEEAEQAMGKKHGKWYGVCPLAGGKDRSHTLERWKFFVKDLPFEKIFLFGSGMDLDVLESVRQHDERIQICTPSTFRTLGAYLKRLDGVVGVDSGPLHYARALNVPSLTLMSGGDQLRWFPSMGKNHAVLRRGLFDRFPFVWEMTRALSRWQKSLNATTVAPHG